MLAKARKRRSRRTREHASWGCNARSLGVRWCHGITLIGLGLCVVGAVLMAVGPKSGCSAATKENVGLHDVRNLGWQTNLERDSSLEQLMRRNMTACAVSVATSRTLDISNLHDTIQNLLPAATTLTTEQAHPERRLSISEQIACTNSCIDDMTRCIMAMPEVQNQMDCALPGFVDRWCGCFDSSLYCYVGCFHSAQQVREYLDSIGSCFGQKALFETLVADFLCDDLVAGQAVGATITSVGAAAVVSSQAAVAMFPATDLAPSSIVIASGLSTRSMPGGGGVVAAAACLPVNGKRNAHENSQRVSHAGEFNGARPPDDDLGEPESKPHSRWEGNVSARMMPTSGQQYEIHAWETRTSNDKDGSHTILSGATDTRVGSHQTHVQVADGNPLGSRRNEQGANSNGNGNGNRSSSNSNSNNNNNNDDAPSPPGDATTDGARTGIRKYWMHILDAQEDWSDIFGYVLHVALIGMVVGQQASTVYSGFAGGFYWTMGGIPIGFLKDGAVGLAKATSSGNVNSIDSVEWVGGSLIAAPAISMNVPGYAFFTYLVILTLLFTTLALLAVLAWRKAVTRFAVAAKAAALLKIPNARKLSAKIIFRTWQTTLILQVGAAVTQLGMPNGGGFLLFIALLWFFGYCLGIFAVITYLIPKGLSAFWDVAYVQADIVTPLQALAPSLQPKPAVVALGGVASPTSTAAATPHTPAVSALTVAVSDGGNGVAADNGLSSNGASSHPTNPLATSSAQSTSLASVNNADGSTDSTRPSLLGPASAMANDQQQARTTGRESKVATVAVSVAPAIAPTVAVGARVHWKATLTAWWSHVRSGSAWKGLKAAHGKDMFRPLAAHSEFAALATSQPLPTLVEQYGSPDGVAQACRTGKTVLTFSQVGQFMPSSFEAVDGFVNTYLVSKSYFAIVDLFAALLLVLCAAALAQVKVLALLALLFLTAVQGYLVRAVRPKATVSANVLTICLSYTKIVATTLAFFQLPVGTFGFKDIMAVVLIIVQGSVSLLLVVKKIRQLVTRWHQIKVWVLSTSIGAKLCCCFKTNASKENKATGGGGGSIATSSSRKVVPSPAHAPSLQQPHEELPRPLSLPQQSQDGQPEQRQSQASPAMQPTAEREPSSSP